MKQFFEWSFFCFWQRDVTGRKSVSRPRFYPNLHGHYYEVPSDETQPLPGRLWQLGQSDFVTGLRIWDLNDSF